MEVTDQELNGTGATWRKGTAKYSADKVIEIAKEALSSDNMTEVARKYDLTYQTLRRYMEKYQESQGVAPTKAAKHTAPAPKGHTARHVQTLLERVEYLEKMVKKLQDAIGIE